MTLLEALKKTGNKLFNKINWKIREIKMQRIFYMRPIVKLRCSEKIVFYKNNWDDDDDYDGN